MLVKLVNKIWPEKVREVVLKQQNKPLELANLKEAFIDSQGRRYYEFPDSTSLPMVRFQKISGFYTLMANGVSRSWMDDWLEEMDKLLTKGITEGKHAAQMGALISEMQQRMQLVLSYDLVMEILAVQFIREDEHPEVFSEAIQQDKVATFLSEQGLPAFFLGRKELQELEHLLGIRGADWNKLREAWTATENVRAQMLQLIQSKESSSSKTNQQKK